ncbi:MAG TPA: glycosyltransferase family 4 protein [Thermoplasmata archaeon]|nr:glycosyltransferase family 4 protein [Thermoplasmata archaeon]
MRVLLIGGGVQPIPPTGYGAVERILDDLRKALVAAGHEADVVNQVRHRRMRDEYPFAWQLPRLLKGRRYDVLHAHTPVVANRLACSGFPFVYTSHSRHWYYRDRLSHRWGYWLERRAVRRASAVIALTPTLERTMIGAVAPPLPPITVIPFGVDSERFRPDWTRRSGREVLGVGVVLPFKRWEIAARALRGLGVRLRIAGPMPSPEYAARVRAAGDRVEMLGEVSEEELVRLYAESDLLLHPSAVEVLSAAVLEGLAAGLPVVGGPAVRGVVEEGVTGWSIPDTDTVSFVAGIREQAGRLVSDATARREMGENARRQAQNRYSWPQVVAAHLRVYDSLRATPAATGAPGSPAT